LIRYFAEGKKMTKREKEDRQRMVNRVMALDLTYYVDTVKFFKKNKKDILALVNAEADACSVAPATLVASFNCLKGFCDDAEGMRDVYRALDGRVNKDDTHRCLMPWLGLPLRK
jgi:hypothetical protein